MEQMIDLHKQDIYEEDIPGFTNDAYGQFAGHLNLQMVMAFPWNEYIERMHYKDFE